MGAALSARLASHLDPELVRQLLDPLASTQLVIEEGARAAMADSIHLVFLIALVAAMLAMVAVLFTPRKELREQLPEGETLPISAD